MHPWTRSAALLTCLLSVVLFAGCKNSQESAPKASGTPTVAHGHDDDDHSHGTGPHGGTIFDLGGGAYHAEFCMDHDKKQATIYILGGDAKKASPIKADKLALTIKQPAFQLELKATPQTGDPAGSSSCFSGNHANFATKQEFAGSVTVEIAGKPYSGDFKEEPAKK